MRQSGAVGPPRPHKGKRTRETSREAHAAIASSSGVLRQEVLAAIRGAGLLGLTADEAAEELGLTPFSTRPRCTELRDQKLITDSGMRRGNASGRNAIVWIAA